MSIHVKHAVLRRITPYIQMITFIFIKGDLNSIILGSYSFIKIKLRIISTKKIISNKSIPYVKLFMNSTNHNFINITCYLGESK